MKLISMIKRPKKAQPCCIRHKETGHYLQTDSGKSVWNSTGAAKSAFANQFGGHGATKYGWRKAAREKFGLEHGTFDEQDIFEIVDIALT